MDIVELQRRVEAVEAAANGKRVSERKLADELDLLAEHLIGESAPELQHYKVRIQTLVARVDPQRHQVEIYLQTYGQIR